MPGKVDRERFQRACRIPLHFLRISMLLLLGGWAFTLQAQPSLTTTPKATVTGALLSDPHLDPFRDPAKAKRLASASVDQWAAILAEPPSPDAATQFAALQNTCTEKLSDADTSLELSGFDDAQAAHPAFVLVAGDMLVHGFACRYHALLDAGGTDRTGLADFAAKTIEFQLAQLRQRFPKTPIHLALGNNDSDCEDYALDSDSRFLQRLATAVTAGWSGVSPHESTAAKHAFEHLGSYALPLAAAVPNTRVIVLDDLFLSADYKGSCGSDTSHANPTALLTWLGEQLAQAKRAHQAVWILAHIPPVVNVYRTYLHPRDICHGEAPATFLSNNALSQLLGQYADTVRVFISGHTHLDEIHLLQSGGTETSTVALKAIPSISPVSTNAPSYLLAQVDPTSATLVDYVKRVASASTGSSIHWTTAYTFREQFQEPAFSAATVNDLLQRWQSASANSAPQIDAYAMSIASGLRLFAFRASFPQQLCAMQHSSAVAFAVCACSAKGGLLPPVQKAK